MIKLELSEKRSYIYTNHAATGRLVNQPHHMVFTNSNSIKKNRREQSNSGTYIAIYVGPHTNSSAVKFPRQVGCVYTLANSALITSEDYVTW